jgi:MoaA/NifB/PqqE/SkfB family radical SAM enzyme
MNTNGGLQSPKWWEGLAKKLNQPKDYVVFSIDGLKDTNHVYRKNVIWERVMANADSFIKSGGLAHWDMLVFEHNEHQVNACQQLAKDMRFYFFRAKVSRRHHDYPISFLKNPKFWQDTLIISDSIRCKALEEKSLYVSAQGIVHPCCWLGYRNGPLLKDFDVIQQNWNTSPNIICKKTCSTVNSVSSFENQWQKEIQLIIK